MRLHARIPYLASCVTFLGISTLLHSALAQQKEEAESELIEEDLSLSELMNMKINLPTRIAQDSDEAPSIVSVITRQDIRRYGARDLADVLRLIPGFEFGADVFGFVGASQRGIWAHEGKALVMINGVLANDLSFGNVNYFGTFPVAMIDRVEIIRGPGSAVFGAFAEVAVINVVTRSGASLNGVDASLSGGAMHEEPTWGGDIAAGTKGENLDIAVHIGKSRGPWSPRPFRDFFGGETPIGYKDSPRDWQHIIVDATYKEALKLHFVHTDFVFGGSNTFGVALPPQPYTDLSSHFSNGLQLTYEWKATDRLSFEPTLEYINGDMGNTAATPRVNEFAAPYNHFQRYRAELGVGYRLSDKGHLAIGAGYWRDNVEAMGSSGTPGIELTDGTLLYEHYADAKFAYAQYIETFAPFGITVGGRYDSTTFGDAAAPRVGLVISGGPVATKLLYGRAFRIPSVFQAYSRIDAYAPDELVPEISDSTEVQIVYSWSPNIKSRVNTFFTRVLKPVTFVIDHYVNYGEISSLGAEAELEIRYQDYGGFLNASYARPGPKTSPDFVTRDGEHFLSVADLKLSLGAYYRIDPIEFGPSLTVLTKRYGQSEASANSPTGELDTTSYPALALADLAVTWHEVVKNTSLQLSVHNAFDAPYVLIAPAYAWHAPLPAHDREVRLQIQSSF